jgi:hypothetical protein
MINFQIIKVNNLETNKVLAGPMGQLHAIKKLGEHEIMLIYTGQEIQW